MDLDEDAATIPSSSNPNDTWWNQLAQEENSALPFDSSEGGLWSGNFVPPPPRPIFIDDNIATDGLTTCDLCTWAWRNGNSFTLDAALAPGEIGWVLTMVIVSLISAVIGAVVMIIVIHCKRMKNTELSGSQENTSQPPQTRQSIRTPNDKLPPGPYADETSSGVWSWLSRRSAPVQPQHALQPVENHYTHMEEPYGSNGGEALYAELDRESSLERAYQNSAYTDPEAQPSSPPSSAYYSDLSVNAAAPQDRAYEVVGMAVLPVWDTGNDGGNRRRLAAISEAASVPSDYV